MDGSYGLPGRVEKGEPISAAATREVKEKVGVDIESIDIKHSLTMHRDAKRDGTLWVYVYFEATRWQGDVVNGEPENTVRSPGLVRSLYPTQ